MYTCSTGIVHMLDWNCAHAQLKCAAGSPGDCAITVNSCSAVGIRFIASLTKASSQECVLLGMLDRMKKRLIKCVLTGKKYGMLCRKTINLSFVGAKNA